MMLADVTWTYYFIEVEARRPAQAGAWSALIILFGAFTAVNYMQDRRLIVAAMIGAFLGTYLTVRYKKSKEDQEPKA